MPDNKFTEALYDIPDIDAYGEAKRDAAAREAFGNKLSDIIYDTFVGSFKDYVSENNANAEAITNTVVKASNNGLSLNDEFTFEPTNSDSPEKNPRLEAALLEYQDELDANIVNARISMTKDPAILAANIGSRYNPYVLPGVMGAYLLTDIMKKENKAEAAVDATIPMIASAGIPSALNYMSKFRGLARLPLKQYGEFLQKHPITMSGLLAGGVLLDEETREWALEHPGRFGYNFFGADIAHAGKKYVATPNDVGGTTPAAGAEAVVTEPRPKPKIEQPESGNNIDWGGGLVYASKESIPPHEGMIQPSPTVQKPKTLTEKAFPENMQENKVRQSEMINSLVEDALEAKRYDTIGQGVFEEGHPMDMSQHKLTFSSNNMYSKPVSVEDAWKTAQSICPSLPNRFQLNDEGTLGYFMPYSEQIRVRGFKSWSTLCHELGHFSSKELNWGVSTEEKLIPQWHTYSSVTGELKQAALSIWKNGEYGDPNTPDGHLTYIEEGRAAFINEYLINPEMAKNLMPLTTADFEEKLALNPELQAKFTLLGQQLRRWGNDSVYQQVNSTISYADKDYVPLFKKISNALLDVEKSVIDKHAPLQKIVRDFLLDVPDTVFDENGNKVIDKKTGLPMRTPKKLRFEDNPANIAQHAEEGINAMVECLMGDSGVDTPTIIKAASDKYGVSLNPVTLKDALKPLREFGKSEEGKAWLKAHGFTDEQGMYEAFSSFLLSRHEHEVIGVQNNRKVEALKEKISEAKLKVKDLIQRKSQTTKETPEGQVLSDSMDKEITSLEKKIAKWEQEKTDINMGRNDYMTTAHRKELQRTIAEGEKTLPFTMASELFNLWNENILRIAVAGGLIKPEDATYFLKTYPNYVPMKRSFVLENNFEGGGIGADKTYANITNIIHALSTEGSERTVKDPLVQAALNLQSTISKVERNKVAKAVVSLSEQEGGGRLLVPIKGGTASNAEQIITVWDKGEQKAYQCMTPGLYEAIAVADKATQVMQLNAIETIAQGSAQALRIGATSTWAFAIRNMVKDLLNATTLNKDGRKTYLPLIDQGLLLMDGVLARLDKNYMAELKTEGMQYTSYIGSGKQINFNLRDYTEGNPHYMGKVWDAIKSVVDVGEQLPRLGLYKRARERGCSPMEAAYIASDGTTNFMRAGTQVKKINRYIPFFNAVIQGNNKVFRAIKDDPIGVGLTAFSYITIPSLICWYQNHDKDWYRDMPLEKKNKNWYWDLSSAKDGSAVIAIPKNELVGYFFGSVPERILDFAIDNDKDGGVLNATVKSTIGQLVPSGFPTALLPIIEWQANYSFFREKPIVDMRLGKLKPQDQYNLYTSEVAKGISKGLGAINVEASPMKIDNTIYDLTGTLGYAATGLVDWMSKDVTTPSRKWTEWTSLTHSPDTANTRSANVFFDGLDRLEAEHGSNAKNSKGKRKLKAPKALEGMRKAKKQADKISLAIKAIDGDETIKDGDLKRQKRDILVKKRNEIFRKANSKYLGYKYIRSPE